MTELDQKDQTKTTSETSELHPADGKGREAKDKSGWLRPLVIAAVLSIPGSAAFEWLVKPIASGASRIFLNVLSSFSKDYAQSFYKNLYHFDYIPIYIALAKLLMGVLVTYSFLLVVYILNLYIKGRKRHGKSDQLSQDADDEVFKTHFKITPVILNTIILTCLYMAYLGIVDGVKNENKLAMTKAILAYSTRATPQQVAAASLNFSEVDSKQEYDELLKELGGKP